MNEGPNNPRRDMDERQLDAANVQDARREFDMVSERYTQAARRLARTERIQAYHAQERALGHRAPRVPERNAR